MRSREETLIECQDLFRTIREASYAIPQEANVAFKENVEGLLKYTDESDNWEDRCYGTNETVVYAAIFVLCQYQILDLHFSRKIKNPEKFYKFVGTWFTEHMDHYKISMERGLIAENEFDSIAGIDCAKAIFNILNNDDEDGDLDN